MIPSTQNPRLRLDLLLALLAGSIAAVVYYLGSAPGVLFGDGGELQFAAWTAGLPHPTGYPLYMTLGWAWSHLLDAAADERVVHSLRHHRQRLNQRCTALAGQGKATGKTSQRGLQKNIAHNGAVSYTHLTLPTNREV